MARDEELTRLAALGEPTRREIYDHVAASGREVSRDEAARAVGVSRKLAAFHLERLLQSGLLEAVYRRMTGRSGPGAGRPAKLYRRAPRETAVSLPERQYDLLARILVAAEPDPESVRRAARDAGLSLHRAGRGRAGLLRTLSNHGYEPYGEHGEIRLRNCPFDAVAQENRSVVCDLNLALLTALRDATGASGLIPALDPKPGCCCVVFRSN